MVADYINTYISVYNIGHKSIITNMEIVRIDEFCLTNLILAKPVPKYYILPKRM
jgi:hypothetical protein